MHNPLTRFIFLGGLVFLLVIGLVGGYLGYFTYGFKSILNAPFDFLKSVVYFGSLYRDTNALSLENESLKAKILELENLPHQVVGKRMALAAKVYSEYPFNNRSLVIINVGKNEGVRVGAPVMIGGIVFGLVDQVYDDQSSVQTVFDPQWKTSVKIGDAGVDGLLVGGQDPKVTLVNKNKQINAGDLIYSVEKKLPYAATLGRVKEVLDTGNSTFNELSVDFSYSIGDINDVEVLLNF